MQKALSVLAVFFLALAPADLLLLIAMFRYSTPALYLAGAVCGSLTVVVYAAGSVLSRRVKE